MPDLRSIHMGAPSWAGVADRAWDAAANVWRTSKVAQQDLRYVPSPMAPDAQPDRFLAEAFFVALAWDARLAAVVAFLPVVFETVVFLLVVFALVFEDALLGTGDFADLAAPLDVV